MKIPLILCVLSLFLISACKVSYKKADLDNSDTDEFTDDFGEDDFGDDEGSDEEVSTVFLNTRVCLEGAFDGVSSTHSTSLSDFGLLPTTSPYDDFLSVTDSDIPEESVDWVYVTLFDAADPETEIASKSVLLQVDGTLYDPEIGAQGVYFSDVESDEYYLKISHRNHLYIESESTVILDLLTGLEDMSVFNVDMTEDNDDIYLVDEALTDFGDDRCMKAGDVDQNGIIDWNDQRDILTSVDEVSASAVSSTMVPGYLRGDVDLNGLTSQDGDKLFVIDNDGFTSLIGP